MNFIILEASRNNKRSYKYANETIQIGAVLLDENFKRISTLCQYVHPEYGVIDHFIESLTGIRNSQVKNAPRIQEALLHMIDWLGDREYQIYAWSESDRAQIVHEIKAKKITDEKILAFVEKENWIDYQAVFAKRYELTRQLSLEEALGRAEIEPEGRFHDGLDDAVNTACLYEGMGNRNPHQDYEPSYIYKRWRGKIQGVREKNFRKIKITQKLDF